MSEIDYIEYYDLEKYLFETVKPDYDQKKTISAEDFFCIVIWKANRAKSKIAKKLLKRGYTDLESAVRVLMQNIAEAGNAKERLRILFVDWEFPLPMASAILTVLYPDEFTIYDYRVSEILKISGGLDDPGNKTKFETLWHCYTKYIELVRGAAPQDMSLRDKDRYLMGKSFKEQLGNDVKNLFGHTSDDSEVEV